MALENWLKANELEEKIRSIMNDMPEHVCCKNVKRVNNHVFLVSENIGVGNGKTAFYGREVDYSNYRDILFQLKMTPKKYVVDIFTGDVEEYENDTGKEFHR